MKKRCFLIPLLALLCILCLSSTLVACDEEPACQHRDADDNALCDTCGEGYTDGTDVTPPPATCQHRDADDNALCDKCGEGYTDGVDVTDGEGSEGGDEASHTHTVQHHKAKAATCTEAGNVEYWECMSCEKYFTAANCVAEFADLSATVIEPTGHTDTLIHHSAKGAACLSAGNIEYWECTACDKYFSNEEATAEIADRSSVVVQATAHRGTVVHHSAKAADCKTAGCVEYWECTACDKYFSNASATTEIRDKSSVVIPAGGQHAYNEKDICGTCGVNVGTPGLVYTLNPGGGSYALTGLGTASGNITVASYYEDLPVTAIGERAFLMEKELTGVSFGEHSPLTAIGESAFNSCSKLATIMLPAGLITIEGAAFAGCSELIRVVVPSSVTTIKFAAFSGCSKLVSVILPSNLTEISNLLFLCCYKLESITIPAGVNRIGEEAFNSCLALQSIVLPNSVREIADQAFGGSGLTNVTFSSNLQTIGSYAFLNCPIETVTIPYSVNCIESGAFYECTALTSIRFERTQGWSVYSEYYDELYEDIDVSVPADNVELVLDTFAGYVWSVS